MGDSRCSQVTSSCGSEGINFTQGSMYEIDPSSLRQHGPLTPGASLQVSVGKDHTLYATEAGFVRFYQAPKAGYTQDAAAKHWRKYCRLSNPVTFFLCAYLI